MTSFALAILLGAFLLFQVQPILGRYLVPWFGGGAGPWVTCLVFFQSTLVLGYFWAHWVTRRLSVGWQWKVHLILVAASLVFLPLAPTIDAWRVGDALPPSLRVLGLLCAVVGLPFLVLASTGPLMQAWWTVVHAGRSPYRLYALSNCGSLLALLSYPLAVEPLMTLTMQGAVWSTAYAVFAVATLSCAFKLRHSLDADAPLDPARMLVELSRSWNSDAVPRPGLWLGCAAAGSILMTSTTTRVCEEVAGAPLLWVAPLAIYLLTLILCFDHDLWYRRIVFLPVAAAGLVAANLHLHGILSISEVESAALHGGVLFATCMVCHGELVRARPGPRHLTWFFLMVAVGAAFGGAFAGLIAPIALPDAWEYHFGLMAAGVIAWVGFAQVGGRVAAIGGAVPCAVLAYALWVDIDHGMDADLDTSRSFYGTLHVQAVAADDGRRLRVLRSGRTVHGVQIVDKGCGAWPTTYYGRESGVGVALAAREGRPRLVGVVGLGVGVIATLLDEGDRVRFYEINEQVEKNARRYFTFLAQATADVEVVIGDGRQLLAQEIVVGTDPGLDVLVVDAFIGGAIPVHMLTREALAIYDARLHSNGVLALHVSHDHLDLLPVVRGLAHEGGFELTVVVSPGEPERAGTCDAVWALLTRDPTFAEEPVVRAVAEGFSSLADGAMDLWTDDLASLVPLIGRGGTPQAWWCGAPMRGCFVDDRAELIDRATEDRLLSRLRSVYRDTHGRCALGVVSQGTDAAGAPADAGDDPPLMLAALGLDAAELGMLLVVDEDGSSARLEVGDGWFADQVVSARALVGAAWNAEGSPRERLFAASEALGAMMRHEVGRRPDAGLASPPRD